MPLLFLLFLLKFGPLSSAGLQSAGALSINCYFFLKKSSILSIFLLVFEPNLTKFEQNILIKMSPQSKSISLNNRSLPYDGKFNSLPLTLISELDSHKLNLYITN